MNGIELIDTGLDPGGRGSYLEKVESHDILVQKIQKDFAKI